MQLNNEVFPSKVLLFGEYSIIFGSLGVAVPFDKYSGILRLIDNENKYKNELIDFCKYLSNLEVIKNDLDLEQFEQDIKNNLTFESNIPKGAGVGSSGAICAAIYAKYLKNNIVKDITDQDQLKLLIDRMALMESFYHGSSSGLDPLVSLSNHSLLVKNRNQISAIENHNLLPSFKIFDTNIGRKTAPLVHLFLEKSKNTKFKSALNQFIEINDSAINSYINNDKTKLDEYVHQISRWQYVNMNEMIVDDVKDLWLEGLESKDFFIKLCGAGGGGHYLVYDVDNNVKEKLRNFNTLCLV